MKRVRLVVIGKIKSPFFKEASSHYARAMERYAGLEIVEVKDAPSSLGPMERSAREGEAILARLGKGDLAVCLDETGQALTSRQLSCQLRQWLEDPVRSPVLIIGGPYGLSEAVKARCDLCLSLGPMTLPHELARVVLLEQLYRAMTILKGLPYHHD